MATADFLRRHLGSAVDATMLSSTLLAPGMTYVGPMTEVDDEVDGSVNVSASLPFPRKDGGALCRALDERPFGPT